MEAKSERLKDGQNQAKTSGQITVFFDGICHLCNGLVDFLIQHETAHSLKFAPLQGETAKQQLTPMDREALDTVIVVRGDSVFKKSDAILLVFSTLGFPWSWLSSASRVVPRSLRNRIYDFVAKHRYDWFGQRQSCRLPKPSEKSQLLP